MKLIKRLASATIAVAMIASISTVAFAGALNFPATSYSFYANKATITQGTTSFKVSFGIVDNADADIDIPNNPATDVANYVGVDSYAYAKLSTEAVAAGIKATDIESSVATIVDPCFYIEGEGAEGDLFGASFAFDKPSFVLNADTPLFTVTFTAPADVELGTYKLFDADGETYCLSLLDKDSKSSGAVVWAGTDFVTVEAAGPQGPTVTEGATANGITEYTFANSTAMDGQKILMTETAKTGSTITANTRFKVTYEGQSPRYFGSDIWEKLAQGAGSISVGSVKFGLIVDEDEDASKFTFEIVEI